MYIYVGRASNGAKNLADELGIKRLKETGRKIPATTNIINWGNTTLPARISNCNIVNTPAAIALVSNKLAFFHAMRDQNVTPWYCTTLPEATARMREKDCYIVCRTVLNGSGGAGIVVAHTVNELVKAPLYVQYIPKQEEYRVHCFNPRNGVEIIDVQRKARKHDVADPNWEIRNLAGGFIYAREGFTVPSVVIEAATVCMGNLRLHFGAVDIVSTKKGKAYVLEVNSAPGLEGTTVEKYAEAFKRWM
jgi:glutathione synthase/RimK-type ligase-like ATP-grasp enzyme